MKRSSFLSRLPVCPAMALLTLASGVSVVSAHPGHGLTEGGLLHAVTSPDHALVCGGIGVGLWVAGRFLAQPRPARMLRSAGVALVAVAVLLLGLRA